MTNYSFILKCVLKLVDLFLHTKIVKTSTILKVAQKILWTRPLTPYPDWRFGTDLADLMSGIRLKIWQYCNRNKVENPIHFNWYHGLAIHLYLGNDLSLCLFVGGCFEPNEFFFLSKLLRNGMTLIDIGANDGLYSLFAAHYVGTNGKVLAVEPSSREFSRLQANIELNRLTNVLAFSMALSDRNGRGELHIAGYEHEGQNTLGDFIYPGVEDSHTEEVVIKTLDDLVEQEGLNSVNIIKMDTEGAEFSILKGAERTLKTYHPVLLMELSDSALRNQGSSGNEVLSELRVMNYDIFVFDNKTGLPVKYDESRELSPNVVAVHKNHSNEIKKILQ